MEKELDGLLKGNLLQKCWPAQRSLLLKKSYDAYLAGSKMESVFYETKALTVGFMTSNYTSNGNLRVVNDESLKEVSIIKQEKKNDLLDYITNKMSGINMDEDDSSNDAFVDYKTGLVDLLRKCSKLPKEWNVVQMTKMNNTFEAFATKKEISTQLRPIKFTLFRYVQSHKLNDKPITFHLEFVNSTNIFQSVFELYQEAYADREKRGAMYQKIETNLAKLIEDVKLWLGPWIVLLSGKVKGEKGEAFEKKIFEMIDDFAVEHKFTDEQTVLLGIVARRLDLLSSDTIKQAASGISDSKKQYSVLMTFLAKLKTTLTFKNLQYYPCIMVMDEMLDNIPWELINPQQEFTRFSSMYLLFDLFEKFKEKISDGYLKLHLKTGNILNFSGDDSKLDMMQKRNGNFFEYWLPEWKRVETKASADIDMSNLMTSADVYVYHGHGSSLQFISKPDLEKLSTETVMLLFGCESVAIKFRGLISEVSAQHFLLHLINCPAVFGAMTIIWDIWADISSVMIFTRWIPSERKKVWTPVHLPDCSGTQARVLKIMTQLRGKLEPSLLANLAEIRCETNIPLKTRAAFICRGLPVYNVLAENREI